MKIVLAYHICDKWMFNYLDMVVRWGHQAGYDIESVCLSSSPPSKRHHFKELDLLWATGNREIKCQHRKIMKAVDKADIFFLFNGAGFHPSWLEGFPKDVLTVFGFYDDPESSESFSKPVSPYFDAALVCNISSLPLYKSWGQENAAWQPIFIDFDPAKLSDQCIIGKIRPVDIVFFGGNTSWRRDRMSKLTRAFPDAQIYGVGWPRGYVSQAKREELYLNAKIGWNLHNTNGPVNVRTHALPAFGVMQICDNKTRLGNIYKLNHEVAGFDSIDECIELTHYYLNHEGARKDIAVNALRRFEACYHPHKVWDFIVRQFEEWSTKKRAGLLKVNTYPKKSSVSSIISYGKYRVEKKLVKIRRGRKANNNSDDGDESRRLRWGTMGYHQFVKCPQDALKPDLKYFRPSPEKKDETPAYTALCYTVASLIGKANCIAEVYCCKGLLSYDIGVDNSRSIKGFETDRELFLWAKKNRQRPNVVYSNSLPKGDERYEIVLCLEELAYHSNYKNILDLCCGLSDMAIYSTSNRLAGHADGYVKVDDESDVSRWSASEFYWILKTFYEKVYLFAMRDRFNPNCVNVNLNTDLYQLIALCENVRQ